MTTTNDFQKIADSLIEEMKEQIDNDIICIRGVTEQENNLLSGAENFEFRPLTEEREEERIREFSRCQGRQILADLAGEAKDSK